MVLHSLLLEVADKRERRGFHRGEQGMHGDTCTFSSQSRLDVRQLNYSRLMLAFRLHAATGVAMCAFTAETRRAAKGPLTHLELPVTHTVVAGLPC